MWTRTEYESRADSCLEQYRARIADLHEADDADAKHVEAARSIFDAVKKKVRALKQVPEHEWDVAKQALEDAWDELRRVLSESEPGPGG